MAVSEGSGEQPDGPRWVNGLDVYASMAPAFRENLGDPQRVEPLLAKYWQRNLLLEDSTGARIDHIRVDPGYEDLSNAYHDSVEECFVLSGAVTLEGEGAFAAGDYFWRPPGFVHKARSPGGFEALLMMQGVDAPERSGPVTRVIRPDEEAGTNALVPNLEVAIGPRGWVRCSHSGLLPWGSATAVIGADSDAEMRLLSRNVMTGTVSALVRLRGRGFVDRSGPPLRCVMLAGDLAVDEVRIPVMNLVELPVSVPASLVTETGCLLFVKSY